MMRDTDNVVIVPRKGCDKVLLESIVSSWIFHSAKNGQGINFACRSHEITPGLKRICKDTDTGLMLYPLVSWRHIVSDFKANYVIIFEPTEKDTFPLLTEYCRENNIFAMRYINTDKERHLKGIKLDYEKYR